MQILNYNKNNIFKLDVPKLYTKKKIILIIMDFLPSLLLLLL